MFRNTVNLKLRKTPAVQEEIDALRGKDLMCWCPLDQPCHADFLLRIANQVQP